MDKLSKEENMKHIQDLLQGEVEPENPQSVRLIEKLKKAYAKGMEAQKYAAKLKQEMAKVESQIVGAQAVFNSYAEDITELENETNEDQSEGIGKVYDAYTDESELKAV